KNTIINQYVTHRLRAVFCVVAMAMEASGRMRKIPVVNAQPEAGAEKSCKRLFELNLCIFSINLVFEDSNSKPVLGSPLK
ncbi:hypothetical protein, partial [Ruegeria sp. 6PALISEP08]|uniref:hypothetical protein n=1 Tax=Ruegeria sp. 6PALISEP08 TaxID=1225660 RepID=UPI001C0FED65